MALHEGLSTPHDRCMAKDSVWETALSPPSASDMVLQTEVVEARNGLRAALVSSSTSMRDILVDTPTLRWGKVTNL